MYFYRISDRIEAFRIAERIASGMEFVGKFDVNVVDERKIEYVRRRNNQGNLHRRTQTLRRNEIT